MAKEPTRIPTADPDPMIGDGEARHRRKWSVRTKVVVAVLAVFALAVPIGIYALRDHIWGVRADARQAANMVKQGSLIEVSALLEEYRGDADFAYFFTESLTPQQIGDGLATFVQEQPEVVSENAGEEYEVALVDLAGTLSLATQNAGMRQFPQSWTANFIESTTWSSIDSPPERRLQDRANQTNLLLILSRGYWSLDFLQQVTRAYYLYDLENGEYAWPGVDPEYTDLYAAAPGGAYLTDGIVSLNAALTANPLAAEWAFTEFLPGDVQVAGTPYRVGRFTHFLMYEHTLPESAEAEEDTAGAASAVTALASAAESADWADRLSEGIEVIPTADGFGPGHDLAVLHVLAQEVEEEPECTWHPRDYMACLSIAAAAVWEWARNWGHVVLDVLSFGSLVPIQPVLAVGISAAALNSVWYALEGDYVSAGLSAAVTLPVVGFKVFSRMTKSGQNAVPKGAKRAADSRAGKAAADTRAAAPSATQRVTLRAKTKQQILADAKRDKNGNLIDPNTGKIIPEGGPFDLGHKAGLEHRCISRVATAQNWSREQFLTFMNHAWIFQVEDPSSNRSGRFEGKRCNPLLWAAWPLTV